MIYHGTIPNMMHGLTERELARLHMRRGESYCQVVANLKIDDLSNPPLKRI